MINLEKGERSWKYFGQQGRSRIEGAVQWRLAACVDISIYDRRHSRQEDFLCESTSEGSFSDPFGDILSDGETIIINVIYYNLSEV